MTITSLLILAAFASPSPADNWPEFHGPKGEGIASAKGLPLEWSEQKNVNWKVPIPGKAWASPVIWGNRIWLSNATADGKVLSVVVVDLPSGKVLQDKTIFKIEKPAYSIDVNSYATPTPCLEEGRVYLHYGSAGTACLDMANNEVLWARQDLPCNHHRGAASSPILFGDLLILTFDGFDYQYVAALDKKTGKTVWRTDRTIDYKTTNGDLKKGFATPTVIEIGGKPQLISPASIGSQAFDPFTGVELWKIYHGGMNNAPRPILFKDTVIFGSGEGGWKMFAIKPDGKGDVSNSHVAWKYPKAAPSRSSPLILGDLLFMVNEGGVVVVLDARTGEQVLQERLRGPFSASPISADGRIYFFNEEGQGFVVAAGREWKILATNKLNDGCMASPAAVGKSLIVRTKTHLYCLEQKD